MINLIKIILDKHILKLVLAIFIIELFSLISFKFPILSCVFFILIAIIVLLFTLYKLEYGLLIALTELMIGSQGYLFYLNLGSFKVSMRLGIFLIVFFVWLFKYFKPKTYWQEFKKNPLWQNFALLLLFIAIGVINGILRHNGLSNVFFDFNGYLYFGLFFVFYEVFKTQRQVINFLKVFLSALIYVCLEIFFTLYLFSHNIPYLSDLFYTWIRDTRVGEITYAGANFFRIFFQSQVWSLEAIFIISCLIFGYLLTQKNPLCHPEPVEGSMIARSQGFLTLFKRTERVFIYLYLILIAVQTSILISFSRSFWLGGMAGFIALFAYLIFIQRLKIKKLAQLVAISISSGVLSIALLFIIANFPLPPTSGLFSASMIADRFAMISGEAGVSSRWHLLPILVNKIKESPLIGTGFGTTVTYKTDDPRIKNAANPEGWYTTYTFEWGYLDTITEIGILGLLVYLVFIGQIMYQGLKNLKTRPLDWLNLGLLLGLVVLLVTHAFSPYLNHPLGIGYLMIAASILQMKKDG